MPNNTNDLTPGEAIHPGELLNDELKSRGIGPQDFAVMSGIDSTEVLGIIKLKMSITLDYAFAIGKALGQDPEIWMNAQKKYDEDQAKIEKQKFVKAMLLVAGTLASNPAYFLEWHKCLIASITNSAVERGIHPSQKLTEAISVGAGAFLDNIFHASLITEGWVFRTESVTSKPLLKPTNNNNNDKKDNQ